jgi:hypothetical protein
MFVLIISVIAKVIKSITSYIFNFMNAGTSVRT